MRILISVLLFFCCASVKAQQAIITTSELPLGIEIINRAGDYSDISDYCDGFDENGFPINLVIPFDMSIAYFLPTVTADNNEGYSYTTRKERKLGPVDNLIYEYEGKSVGFLGSLSYSPGSRGYLQVNFEDAGQSKQLINFQFRVDYKEPHIEEVLLGSEIVELIKESYGKDIFDITTRKYDAWKEKGYSSTGGDTIPTDLVLPRYENSIFFNITGNYDVTRLILERNGEEIAYDKSEMLFNWVMDLSDLKPGNYKLTVVNDEKVYGEKIDSFEFTIKEDFWGTWGYWLIGTLVVMAIFFIIYRINAQRKLDQANALKQISEAELKAIRSQLNPHFLFNALNAIQNLVNKSETEKANDYIAKLAKLMRNVLSQSDESLHALSKEIELSNLYLALENMRVPFDFEIQVDRSIDQNMLVPTMILQPYLENAVVHGVNKAFATIVSVKIFEKEEHLILEVKDNGKPESTFINEGRGMSLGKDRIEIIKKQLGSEAKVGIKTRASSEEGFLVTIQLPTNL
ncbi:sensor histidine kinase [Roseivirga misakiensis]|uniref:Signal transduction histidine kinase internal region domain-containing protein n=1 Tax=Roseivirga misakiensis TaxID=1563681 RepID=A0A1E5T6D4_9BACT|nr:histidine kinase [Roseivirga misakiensis]OEK06954.1 hypothetical protein BFP71_04670 [Roseivirga misakiensis]